MSQYKRLQQQQQQCKTQEQRILRTTVLVLNLWQWSGPAHIAEVALLVLLLPAVLVLQLLLPRAALLLAKKLLQLAAAVPRRRSAGSTCAGWRSLERGYRYLITKLTPCENFSGFWQNQQMKDVWRAVHSAIWEAQNKQHNANWQLQRLVKAGSFVNETSLNGA